MNVAAVDSTLARQVHAFCRDRFVDPDAGVRRALKSSPLWRAVAATGSELWLDTGDVDAIRALWTREFSALTTNNTLLNKEVQKGLYDELVPDAAAILRSTDRSIDDDAIVLEIAFVLNAIHGLGLVRTFDADVSVELHTAIANDAEASYRYGKRYAAIHPERFIVKVPLTPAGLIAARRLADDGIRVNFTLGFSARQNHLIATLARPTWVNVFMGRLNSFVADNGLGDGRNVGEKATLSSQRALRALGSPVRQIGASIRSGTQVLELCGVDVLTIPTAAATEFVALGAGEDAIVDRTNDDPPVSFARGVDARSIDVLWDVDDGVRAATAAIEAIPVARWTPDVVHRELRRHGAAGVLPALAAHELAQIAADGKIPRAETWAEHVARGDAGWDGLSTLAGLASFAADQAKLDARVRSLL